MNHSSPTSQVAEVSDLRRSVSNTLKGSAGNLIEWYDVYVYSAFAGYFESQFFSSADKNSAIYVWAIFAATFLMRPLGAWYFGRYADRFGRRSALTFSVSIMALCSFVIALTPTVSSIGIGASIILLIARLLQGFATGGEYGTSATYMSESALKGWRGFMSSFNYVTLIGGQVVAQLVLLILLLLFDHHQVSVWGWRVAFGLGGVAAIGVYFMRKTMDESLKKTDLDKGKDGKNHQGSMIELLTHYWKPLLVCLLVTAGGTIAFYTYSVTAPRIIQSTFVGHDIIIGSVINLIMLGFLMVLQPIGGALSDIWGRKPLLVFFGMGGVLYTGFMLKALPTQTSWLPAALILGVGFIILTGYTSINAVVKAELFPSHVRALGVGFGYAVANSLFGGTAPLLYQASLATQHMTLFIGYITIVIGISLLTYIFGIKNRKESLLDS
ncbi:Alpha-ketoglutarate permease [Halomonadaceae bacterium LMG 33818]|uniref:MFS transporter n=1 Tax=Cernens ardua TaxID=3402176 RepID=UPI003EDC2670